MARIGTGVQAGLGAINYTPYLQGSVAGSEAMGRGIASLGQAAGAGLTAFFKTKEQEDLEKALGKTELANLSGNIQQSKSAPNKDLYATAPNVTDQQIADLNRRINGSNPADRKAAIAEVASLNQRFKEAPVAALQNIQFNAAQNALKQQEIEAKNNEAFTKAFGAIPETKQTTTKVPEVKVTTKAPQFTGLGEFMYGANKQESPSKTVMNMAPAGASEFLAPNRLRGQYDYLSDRAADAITKQEQVAQQAMPRIEEIKKILKDGYINTTQAPIASGMQGITVSQSKQIPLTPMMKNELENEQYALEQQTNQQMALVNDLKKRASAAEKFAGQPLTKEAGDPVIERAANALAQFDKRVDVLKRNVTAEIVDREKQLDVPLTPDERMKEFMGRYIQEGGTLTPKIVSEMRRSVGADIEHFQYGDVQGIRIGDSVKLFDSEKKPLSVASLKYADERMYEQLVSAAARAGLDRLSQEEREILAQLNSRYGPSETDVTGTVRKRYLEDVIKERAINLGLAVRNAPTVGVPPTPSKTGVNRFSVQVDKP